MLNLAANSVSCLHTVGLTVRHLGFRPSLVEVSFVSSLVLLLGFVLIIACYKVGKCRKCTSKHENIKVHKLYY